jgi:hypothetical protein
MLNVWEFRTPGALKRHTNIRWRVIFRLFLEGICSLHTQSLAKIEEIHAAPVRVKPSQRLKKTAGGNPGRTRVKNSDLPAGTTERFTKDVLPIVHDTAGALLPWDCPNDDQVIIMWNLIFGNEHPISEGVKDDLFPAVKSLVSSCIVSIHHL